MPCSLLYASWMARRRSVSAMAARMLPVSTSAYMMTVPFTLRAARPDVWMSAPAERRKPSLSASRMATSDTSGRSSPSRSRLMPTSTSNVAAPEIAQDLDALERLDVRVQVAHPHAELVVVLRQVFGHPLGQRGDEHALARRDARSDLGEQIVHLPGDGPDDHGRVDQARRPDHLLDDHAARLLAARTGPGWPRRTPPAALATPTPRSSAAGCRAPTAGGSRSRPAPACGPDRRGTCRGPAARSDGSRPR